MSVYDKLRNLMLNDTGFAFDPATGFTYNISLTGLDVIRWLKDGLDRAAVLERMGAEYDVEPARAEHDLETFLGTLGQYGLDG